MTTQTVLTQLRLHSIEHTVQDGQVMALDVATCPNRTVQAQWLNVTAYTFPQLMIWLGY